MSTQTLSLTNLFRASAISVATFTIAACGGGGGGGTTTPPPPAPTTYTIGGTTTGLTGAGLQLALNSGVAQAVTGATFTLTPALASGTAYTVAIAAQPAGQTCTLAGATGTATANVTSVAVTCTNNPVATFAVSGTVTGLTGSGLVLTLNGANDQAVTAGAGARPFAFPAINSGTAYTVAVKTQPTSPTQTCVVTNGTGTITAAVTTVAVACTTAGGLTVGGSITNLRGTLVLQNNAANDLTLSSGATIYSFAGAASGTPYAVTVLTQPGAPIPQTCVVTGGSGTLASANVTANIACTDTDVVAPTIASRTPVPTVVGTSLATTVVANFSEAVDPATVTVSSFTLVNTATGTAIPTAAPVLSNGNARATITPNANLAFNTSYTATLTTAVKDPTGNAIAAPVTWTFNTGKKVAAGGYHTCARLDGVDLGKIKCWGSNNFGQLGNETTVPAGDGTGTLMSALTPVNFGTANVVGIWAGENHTCARLDNDAVKCWGRNDEGQLGLGDQANRGDGAGESPNLLSAVSVGTGRTALELGLGAHHTCARLDDGTVKCWGENTNGIAGQDTATPRYTSPGAVVNFGTGLRATALGENGAYHTCAILSNAAGVYQGAKCWGHNDWGQLGQGNVTPVGDDPSRSVALSAMLDAGPGRTISQIVATSGHTCALLDNGATRCWGNNWFGQMGIPSPNAADCVNAASCLGDDPGELQGSLIDLGPGVVGIELIAGDRHSCVRFNSVTFNQNLKCWGWNDYGTLGLGDAAWRGDDANEMGTFLPYVLLSTTLLPVEVDAGAFHNCAVLSSGVVKCWGFNEIQVFSPPQTGQGGQLGYDHTDNLGDGALEMGAFLNPVPL